MVGTQEQQYQYGWGLASLMVVTVFVNLVFVLYFGIRQLYLIAKRTNNKMI